MVAIIERWDREPGLHLEGRGRHWNLIRTVKGSDIDMVRFLPYRNNFCVSLCVCGRGGGGCVRPRAHVRTHAYAHAQLNFPSFFADVRGRRKTRHLASPKSSEDSIYGEELSAVPDAAGSWSKRRTEYWPLDFARWNLLVTLTKKVSNHY